MQHSTTKISIPKPVLGYNIKTRNNFSLYRITEPFTLKFGNLICLETVSSLSNACQTYLILNYRNCCPFCIVNSVVMFSNNTYSFKTNNDLVGKELLTTEIKSVCISWLVSIVL